MSKSMLPHSTQLDANEALTPHSKMRKVISIASTMAEGALLMKEEDAAILERGVRDSCSSGDTPLLAPIPTTSPTGLSMLPPGSVCSEMAPSTRIDIFRFKPGGSLDAVFEQSTSRASFRSEQAEEEQVPSSAMPLDSDQDNLRHRYKEISTNAGSDRVMFRRCLSGNIVPLSTNSESNDQTSDSCVISMQKSSTEELHTSFIAQGSEPELVHEHDFLNDIQGDGMKTSKSYDRRLNEAAQFAEAVGEMPPSQANEFHEIIEEVESDSDDDSNNEVHHDKCPPICRARANTDVSMQGLELTTAQSGAESSKMEKSGLDESFAEADDSFTISDTCRRPKTRPHWPFKGYNWTSQAFLHKLPEEPSNQEFVYKGICSNPPEITKRGISRGNYAQLHRKAWLEVSDKYHRYGKNLRLYYRYWERLGFPTNQFFDWLDSKGEAAGQPLPNLPECPRSQLDSDTVLYINNPEITQKYSLTVVTNDEGRGVVLDVDGDPVKTGPEGWIFVLRDSTLYGAQKITSVTGQSKQRFHHSSFFCGKAVAAAGIFLTDDYGVFYRLYPHSGHYRPGEADMQRMLFYLHHNRVNLRTLDMDTQQILHVARQETSTQQTDGEQSKEKKKKKVDSLYLQPAVFVACLLAHKARFIGEGVFDQIHKIRKSDVTSVSEALIAVDEGV